MSPTVDITTIVGLIAGFTLIVMGIFNGGDLVTFIDIPSLLFTMGGTLAAFLIASSLQEVVSFSGCIKYAFYFPAKFYANVHPGMFQELNMRKPDPATDEELERLRFRLLTGPELLRRMRPYPIGFGVLSVFVGIVIMLRNLDDPSAIGPGLALALLTVFYGVLFTYLLILPLSQKLEARLKLLDEKFWRS